MTAKETILARLADYDRETEARLHKQLVDKWKETFPSSATESSATFHPLLPQFIHEPPVKDAGLREPDEEWYSDIYYVTVRRWKKDPVFGTDGGMIQLGICSVDGTARHDWRDFQEIKNQLAGPECEAFELYPAESRLLDPSNFYTLWCFPGVKRLKIGSNMREVRNRDEAYAPQRAIAEENR